MKKLFLFLGLFIFNVENVWAETATSVEVDAEQKVQQETEKYKQQCSRQAYPSNYTDSVYAMMDDSLKSAHQKYNQCIKNVIINKISAFASKENSEKMLASLNMLQKGVLDFYWTLYNMEDNGVIGRQQNDAAMGYYYNHILEDVILYEQNYNAQ